MNKSESKSFIPELRFPEFIRSPEWKLSEIGEIFDITRGYVLSMRVIEDKPSTEYSYPVYSSQTKNNGLAGYYKDYLYENAITWTTDGANAGDVNYRQGKFYCTNVCGVLLNSSGYANTFTAALLNTVTKQHVSYVGNPKLMNGVMSKITVPFPKVEEQKKISECLSSIDNLITVQDQKMKALKVYRKGLMQKLFPSGREVTPELRFPEFRNLSKWKKEPFSKLFTIGGGKDHKHLVDGDIPVYGSGGYMRSANEYLYDGESACIGRKGTINKPMLLIGKFWTVDTLFYTHSFKGCLPKFIYLLFQNINWLTLNEAGGVPSLSKVIINKVEVMIPEINEQQEIVDCIFSIDETIEQQKNKIEVFKEHKKGLIQKLFPSTKII